MNEVVTRTAAPGDVLMSSVGMLFRHAFSASPLLRNQTVQRIHLPSHRLSRTIRALQTDAAADIDEDGRMGTKVKRKVAMHVAYCGTGYQGGRL